MAFAVDILNRAAPKGILWKRALKKVFGAPWRFGILNGFLAGPNSQSIQNPNSWEFHELTLIRGTILQAKNLGVALEICPCHKCDVSGSYNAVIVF